MSGRINRRMAIRAPFNYEEAQVDPTVNDDDTLGYRAGDRWLNLASDEEFVCFDGTTGAAVWVSTTGTGGGPVTDPSAYDAENKQGSTISEGMLVAVHSSGTGIVLASAANGLKPAVGLMQEDTITSVSGAVQTENIFTLADWSAVTGSATLTRGPYYLDATTPGMMSATAPAVAGQVVQAIGYALSTTDLDISIQPAIRL